MALLLAWLFGRVKSSTTFKGFKLLLEIAFVVQRALFKKMLSQCQKVRANEFRKKCVTLTLNPFSPLSLSRSNFMMNFLSFEFGWREIRLLKISLNAKQIKHVSQKQIMQII